MIQTVSSEAVIEVFLVFHTIPSDAFFDGSYASKCR
jgi:hypothetical protein